MSDAAVDPLAIGTTTATATTTSTTTTTTTSTTTATTIALIELSSSDIMHVVPGEKKGCSERCFHTLDHSSDSRGQRI